MFSHFFYTSHTRGLIKRNVTASGNEANPIMQKKSRLFEALTGEERPLVIGGLVSVLVLLLHVWIGLWLLKPSQPSQTPIQMTMEVSLVSMFHQQAEPTPPTPPKPAPEPPKKQPDNKLIKKKNPLIPKPVVTPTPQAIVEEKLSHTNLAPQTPVVTPPVVSQPAPAVVSHEPKISSAVIPLERIPPKYPARAANRHIEGWVKIEFTITTNGTVEDAVVVEAQPADIFDEAALNAINQWTFKEKIVNGVAVKQRAVQTLQFKLTK
jgi:protein TonB